jgi:hypothetical protein
MMRKVFSQRPWPLLVGLALIGLPAGCGEPNDRNPDSGISGAKGVADPKYAAGTPEQYKQQHQDAEKTTPTKGNAAPKAKP